MSVSFIYVVAMAREDLKYSPRFVETYTTLVLNFEIKTK